MWNPIKHLPLKASGYAHWLASHWDGQPCREHIWKIWHHNMHVQCLPRAWDETAKFLLVSWSCSAAKLMTNMQLNSWCITEPKLTWKISTVHWRRLCLMCYTTLAKMEWNILLVLPGRNRSCNSDTANCQTEINKEIYVRKRKINSHWHGPVSGWHAEHKVVLTCIDVKRSADRKETQCAQHHGCPASMGWEHMPCWVGQTEGCRERTSYGSCCYQPSTHGILDWIDVTPHVFS